MSLHKRGTQSFCNLNSLGARLALTLGIVLAVFVVLFTILLSTTHRKELLRETTLATQRLAETVRRSIGYYMLNHKPQQIQSTVDQIGEQDQIAHIRMMNDRGSVMYSSNPDEVGSVLQTSAAECHQCHATEVNLEGIDSKNRSRTFVDENGRHLLSVVEVVRNEKGCWSAQCHAHPEDQKILGVLDIAVSVDDMNSRLTRSTITPVLAASGGIAAICVLAGIVVYRLVSRPIAKLLAGCKRVADGDFYHQISVARTDEIGQLTSGFNYMTERLRSHVQKLTDTQEQLFHSQKLASLGKMAAGVAHELNSPLTVILNDASLLLQDARAGSREKKDLEVIVAEAKRCGEIIHNMLEFTRIEKPRKRPANLNTVVNETLELVRHQAILHDIEVSINLAPELPSVRIDTNQIKQVFLDMISNAVHAMPDGGHLTVSSKSCRGKKAIVVIFEDTGCGITEENIEKIFEPFFTTKDAKSGTGLGLAICNEIIQKHGGRIEVKSTVGEGSTFSVEIPTGLAGEQV